MTDREQALLALAAALWRELATVRQADTWTNCFDNGSPHGQVRNAAILCAGQCLGAPLEAAIGEPMERRLPCLEQDIRAALQRERGR